MLRKIFNEDVDVETSLDTGLAMRENTNKLEDFEKESVLHIPNQMSAHEVIKSLDCKIEVAEGVTICSNSIFKERKKELRIV